MTLSAAAAALLCAVVLTGCASPLLETASPSSASSDSETELLAAHDLDGLDAAQVVEKLDTMPVDERPSDLTASVQPDILVLSDDQGRQAQLPMPEDRTYVSVAPYREQTHDCYFHSLTTCLGELDGEDVRITLTDSDGEQLISQTRETFDNGFVGMWVPRGIEADLRIEHDGRSGTATVRTMADDDPTCLTTLRLT